jgi:hypothetical protein
MSKPAAGDTSHYDKKWGLESGAYMRLIGASDEAR